MLGKHMGMMLPSSQDSCDSEHITWQKHFAQIHRSSALLLGQELNLYHEGTYLEGRSFSEYH